MTRLIVAFIILLLLFISTEAIYSGFPENTLPTLAMRIHGSNVNFDDIDLELLCKLSWQYFDAVNFSGTASNEPFQDLMSLCDRVGMYYSICPNEIMQYLKEWGDSTYRYWFRNSDSLLTSDLCFAKCNEDFTSLVDSATADAMYEDSVYSIKTTAGELAVNTADHDFLWFYEVYDEGPAQQWRNAIEDATEIYHRYIPNIYTQDTRSGDTLSLEEVEASGIFSIQKYYTENDTLNPVTFTLNFSLMHTIEKEEYTGLVNDINHGTMVDQATSVRAIMEAEYQLPLPDDDSLEANAPEFIGFDYYTFRYVNIDHASTTTMCDDDWLFLIDHFEEGIDSTIIPALEYDVPVYFFPQTFGKSGGPSMYDSGGSLDYWSYYHRKPAAQEFRMICTLLFFIRPRGYSHTTCAVTWSSIPLVIRILS